MEKWCISVRQDQHRDFIYWIKGVILSDNLDHIWTKRIQMMLLKISMKKKALGQFGFYLFYFIDCLLCQQSWHLAFPLIELMVAIRSICQYGQLANESVETTYRTGYCPELGLLTKCHHNPGEILPTVGWWLRLCKRSIYTDATKWTTMSLPSVADLLPGIMLRLVQSRKDSCMMETALSIYPVPMVHYNVNCWKIGWFSIIGRKKHQFPQSF